MDTALLNTLTLIVVIVIRLLLIIEKGDTRVGTVPVPMRREEK